MFSNSGCGSCAVQGRRLGVEAACGKVLRRCGTGAVAQGLPHVQDQEQPRRGATPCPRPWARPTGDTPHPRSWAAAVLCWSSREEIPHAQGKRNPSKTVGVVRGHQRADTLKPYSQKTSQSNHTRTTAWSNSVKLSHAHGATKDGQVMVERSDRMWSTGEGNGKPLQYSCLENPMNSMKKQKDRTLKEELPSILLEISGEITPEKMKRRSQSKNNTQLWMWLVEARSDAVKSDIA